MRAVLAWAEPTEQKKNPAPARGQTSTSAAGPRYVREGSIENVAFDLLLRSTHGKMSKRVAANAAPDSSARAANATIAARRSRTARRRLLSSTVSRARRSISSGSDATPATS
jgi:hypothetical protein